MEKQMKIVAIVTLVMCLYATSVCWAFWYVLVRPGVVSLDVHDRNEHRHISLGVPAFLLDTSVDLARISSHHVRSEIQAWRPAIRAAALEMDRHPNMTLADIESDGQHVRISRRDGALVVDVDAPDAFVHLTIPASSVDHALASLAD